MWLVLNARHIKLFTWTLFLAFIHLWRINKAQKQHIRLALRKHDHSKDITKFHTNETGKCSFYSFYAVINLKSMKSYHSIGYPFITYNRNFTMFYNNTDIHAHQIHEGNERFYYRRKRKLEPRNFFSRKVLFSNFGRIRFFNF